MNHSSVLPAVSAESALRCGSILNAFGEPIDLRGRPLAASSPPVISPAGATRYDPIEREPVRRETIRKVFSTGVRAIDGLLTLGAGQRIALVADAGPARSELLGWIARRSSAGANVILLVGIQPQDLRRFVESGLGEEAMRRSVVVAALDNQPPTHLARGTALACQIAERLCEHGQEVLLAVDSLSRLTAASSALSNNLIGCAGNRGPGAVTGIYVLEARADQPCQAPWTCFDALIRSRNELLAQGYGPPIDFLQSWRRGPVPTDPQLRDAAALVHRLVSVYHAIEEQLNRAAYRTGADFETDLALRTRQAVLRYLQQSPGDFTDFASARVQLLSLQLEIEKVAIRLAGAATMEAVPTHHIRLGVAEEQRALAG